MKKAIAPGANTKKLVLSPVWNPSKNALESTVPKPSIIMQSVPRLAAMMGANQNIVAQGLSIPISFFCSNICVSAHRRPPTADAKNTRIIPDRTKCVSVATISTTPEVMRKMTRMSRREKDSRRKRKANPSTNTSEDDLHIATGFQPTLVPYASAAFLVRRSYCRTRA